MPIRFPSTLQRPSGKKPGKTTQASRAARPGQQAGGSLTPAGLEALSQEFRARFAAGDHAGALAVAGQARAALPQHPRVLADVALCEMRLGRHLAAYQTYHQALRLAPDDDNLRDGLCELCGYLGYRDEMREHGLRALALKDAQVAGRQALPLPPGNPPPLSADRRRNIIAYSLFGENPRYCETAMLNVLVAAQLFPQWTCRFYCDASVPEGVRWRLAHVGAQVVMVPEPVRSRISGLMWRFLVLEDYGVDRFLLRDADSLLSTREQAAVDAWLGSDRWFHLMRDYHSHTELLLAGMWGGCGGVFSSITPRMEQFISEGQYLGLRVVDQHFLRAHVWPTVRQSLLAHDSVFGFMAGQPFPAHVPHGLGDNFHVGCNLGAAEIGGTTSRPDGSVLNWRIVDEQQREICRYSCTANEGRWRVGLPTPYAERINAGLWRAETIEPSAG